MEEQYTGQIIYNNNVINTFILTYYNKNAINKLIIIKKKKRITLFQK